MARRRHSRRRKGAGGENGWIFLVVLAGLFMAAPEKTRNSVLGSLTLPILAMLVGLAFVLLMVKLVSGLSLRARHGLGTTTPIASMAASEVDTMDPFQFEHYVASLLRFQGFRNIQVTKKSGDWGADIIAERESQKYTIQVKRWRKDVTDRAVKEAVFAKTHYACSAAMVITNSYFTAEAKHWGKHYDCTLVDRDTLMSWKRQAERGQVSLPRSEGVASAAGVRVGS